ncbi:MAG: DUF1392 domain-containing protein [Mojavia pulchra JT2-VF2]|jgi:hypothetical protein|uniref:DUF1392 domain-containing protein n=1 Tax=Mojavia pulchra JT2-VF2 TaxID=287848 RepID=A0A951Q5T9_9NOST|nr:DUF1392 domain-containing protein [Mojavia pulchra JT2-VF2]
MEAITELERCWFLSPPWGNQIPSVGINLLEKVYLKTDRTFGHCCGVQWYQGEWNYVIDVENDIVRATKHEILGTGRIKPTTVKKPAFVLGERVLLQFPNRGTNQRLILGIELIEKSWFYKVELASPTFSPPSSMTNRFSLVREEDLMRVNV